MSKEKPNNDTLEKWHKDPNNWKWVIFYFNKEDDRILIPKRIKWMGWTVNYANPSSIFVFLIAIVFFILAVTLLQQKK